MKICIDAGHGGRDPGAISADGRYREKDNTLAIARAIQERAHWLPGVEFVFTRLEDRHFDENPTKDLAARVKIANNAGADLFISLHQNADPGHMGKGVETYFFRRHATGWESTEGKRLAQCLQDAVVGKTGLIDRGAKGAMFYVIRWTDMPAVLVEAGFVGGDLDEAVFVSQPQTHAEIAEGILQGLAEYLGTGLKKPDPEVEKLRKEKAELQKKLLEMESKYKTLLAAARDAVTGLASHIYD